MDGDVSSYRDLLVWQRGMDLAEQCYLATKQLPKEETFGMVSQIRRSAASIPANVAEGYGRDSTGAYVQFLRNAQGSLKELETHILLAKRVNLLASPNECELLTRTDELGRMLRSLIRSIQKSADG